ncbi:unnamed protein product [Rhizopus stolonifer]
MPLTQRLIQIIHIWNTLVGTILFGLLIGVSSKIKTFITNGGEAAGYGNFQTFAYPATFVYMFIPTITATLYSSVLAFDSSSRYKAWHPSNTMQVSIFFFTVTLLLAALLPEIPGADVMTDGPAIECSWTNYMQWKIIFNNPIAYPWVTSMNDACSIFKTSIAFCWVLFIGWLTQFVYYMRATRCAKTYLEK